jgi:transposase-like protein
VYNGESEGDRRGRAEGFRATWHTREPETVANVCVDFDKTLSYVQVEVPQSLASLTRTTTLLERFHKETRRKQRDIGMFQSEQGCEVLWYLLSIRETAKQRAALQGRR